MLKLVLKSGHIELLNLILYYVWSLELVPYFNPPSRLSLGRGMPYADSEPL